MMSDLNIEKRAFIRKMIAYESGEMQDPSDVIEFFQEMIDDGLAQNLRGSYGQTTRRLIKQGLCRKASALR